MTGRILGLDPGERRIGVAVSDLTGTIASPVRYIDTQSESVLDAVSAMCDEEGVVTVVVGLPIGLDGSEGASAERARAFGAEVAEATGLPVEFQDERFTSHTAETALIAGGMKRKARKETRDKVAAAVMLQNYLDRAARHDL